MEKKQREEWSLLNLIQIPLNFVSDPDHRMDKKIFQRFGFFSHLHNMELFCFRKET